MTLVEFPLVGVELRQQDGKFRGRLDDGLGKLAPRALAPSRRSVLAGHVGSEVYNLPPDVRVLREGVTDVSEYLAWGSDLSFHSLSSP